MKQPRKQAVKNSLTFQDYLAKFDPKTLQSAVAQLNDSIGWELVRSYLKLRQREFEVASLDLTGHTGKIQEAAKASGYAQACEDVAETFLQQLVDSVAGKDGLVEGPTRTEE